MMQLTTYIEVVSQDRVRVLWATGAKNRGVVDVLFARFEPENALVAELAAIRELLFVRNVLGQEPSSAKGIKLTVSQGAVRKIALGTSTKPEARYGRYFKGRLDGVRVEVQKKKSGLLPEGSELAAVFEISPRECPHETINTAAMGTVDITQHALDQYVDRIESGEPANPWASLVKRLRNPNLRRMNLPKDVLEHKARKYGRSDNVEVWGHDSSTFYFLTIIDQDVRTLVTVFNRSELS